MSAKASTIIASAIATLRVTSSPHKINADIISLCREGQMKEAIQFLNFSDHRGIQLKPITYNSLLQICTRNKALSEGKQIYKHMLLSGFEPDLYLSTKLISLYVMCDSLQDACLLFDKMPTRNIFSWNAMPRGYMRNEMFQ